eukprot:TRINITY_DN12475_c0_g1_i3.p1 TRINITY_DN12475_c0_g1~~TRINITY_DN12475_c0_g1_i3.p1  ORF type:complete len:129 (-),score=21.27 TRINITY_DN12475_c0_g1_i3:275-661(-)
MERQSLFFFFSSRRRHTRSCLVSWARRCVQETAPGPNRYNTARSTTSGPSYGFGTSVRSRALSQSQTGPGSYDLQTTIGMVPKYLLSKKDSNHRELPENEANFQVSLTKFTSLPQSLSGDQQNLFSGR